MPLTLKNLTVEDNLRVATYALATGAYVMEDGVIRYSGTAAS